MTFFFSRHTLLTKRQIDCNLSTSDFLLIERESFKKIEIIAHSRCPFPFLAQRQWSSESTDRSRHFSSTEQGASNERSITVTGWNQACRRRQARKKIVISNDTLWRASNGWRRINRTILFGVYLSHFPSQRRHLSLRRFAVQFSTKLYQMLYYRMSQ
jgi:hypothetical protein